MRKFMLAIFGVAALGSVLVGSTAASAAGGQTVCRSGQLSPGPHCRHYTDRQLEYGRINAAYLGYGGNYYTGGR